MGKMLDKRLSYYRDIDDNASSIAKDYVHGTEITKKILEVVIEMYQTAKVEQEFKDDFFETAYHSPITAELEFFIARILYHYSKMNNKNWKILLRRQEKKTAPDIRLVKNNKTVAIIEIKAKAGWIQPFLSPDRYQNDKNRLHSGKTTFDPETLVANSKNQFKKYLTTFEISKEDIFLLLPTLALVHRKKYNTELSGYYAYFEKTSDLPKENLILLSANRRLDLSHSTKDLSPTKNFEGLLDKLSKK